MRIPRICKAIIKNMSGIMCCIVPISEITTTTQSITIKLKKKKRMKLS